MKRKSYHYSSRRKGLSVRHFVFLAIILLTVFFGYRQYVNAIFNSANTQLSQGDLTKAAALFQRAANLPLTHGRGHDGLGALALLRGDHDAAKGHFNIVLDRKPSRMGGDPSVIFQTFIGQARYREGADYREFLRNWKSDKRLEPFALDFAAISVGLRDLTEAQGFLAAVDSETRQSERCQRLEQQVEKLQRDGIMPALLDQNGASIIVYDFSEKAYAFEDPKLFEGWLPDGAEDGDIGRALAELAGASPNSVVQVSLDLNLQRAAYQAMRDYRGTMVLIEPETGDILAAYGTEGFNPFLASFEPGSVIKVLTYGFLLGEDRTLDGYAPKKYASSELIGGKIFYDWTTQGQLDSVEEGMAVSCNLMFARMGIDLGWPKLKRGLERLFDGQSKPGYWGSGSYGRIVREPEGAWELGRAAIGLEFLDATVLGLALIPAAIANGGQPPQPRLARSLANVEGVVYHRNPAQKDDALFEPAVAERLKQSMVQAVVSERGTARRAEVDFVETAMKTGTAGDRPFDSVMIGLLPAQKPKLAFGFYLHRGGKCEINGAKVAKNLLEQIKALAPGYLED